jgi:hypothetical protein
MLGRKESDKPTAPRTFADAERQLHEFLGIGKRVTPRAVDRFRTFTGLTSRRLAEGIFEDISSPHN